jgi:CheY-like chemotaxis protein
MAKSILLVEDNEDDVFFITRAFKAVGMLAHISRVENGQNAIDYLSGKQPYDDRARFPLPSLVLLDLKMPFLSGFEVLRWIRNQSSYCTVPVIIFTSSNQERDVEMAYELGANAYLVKPDQPDQCSDLAHLIKRFWLDVNLPPPIRPAGTATPGVILPSLKKNGERAGEK